jgi:hypothetical protein
VHRIIEIEERPRTNLGQYNNNNNSIIIIIIINKNNNDIIIIISIKAALRY